MARMLCPQKRRFADHWTMTEDGAIPAGNFGRFMGRNRCQEILRDLHFVDNDAERTRDKLWKLRPIVDRLQQRFLAAWSLPSIFPSTRACFRRHRIETLRECSCQTSLIVQVENVYDL